LVFARINLVLATWAAAVSKECSEMKEIRTKIYDMYVSEIEHAADHPDEPGTYGMSIKLTTEQAAHLTQIADGIVIGFSCRNRECLYFGDNSMWLEHEDGSHYMCPMCLRKYVPWTTSRGEVPFQKVVCLRDPLELSWKMIPALWPGSHADSWLLRQAEAYAAMQVVDGERINPFAAESSYKLSDLLKRSGQPSCFNHYFLKEENKPYIASVYPRDPTQYSRGWARFETEGFYGNFLDKKVAEEPGFAEWDELVQAIGNCLAASRALSRL
jgi:hypothetical protein